MTPNFDERHDSNPSGSATEPDDACLDNLKRDRFELLSAYLDGEVSAAERRQVEDWLQSDLSAQRLHARLLKLRQNFRTLPVPPSEQPVELMVQQVVSRIEHRPKRRLLLGGLAIAALFVSAVLGNLPNPQPTAQMARSTIEQPRVPSDGLMIALDRPIMAIPATALKSSGNVE